MRCCHLLGFQHITDHLMKHEFCTSRCNDIHKTGSPFNGAKCFLSKIENNGSVHRDNNQGWRCFVGGQGGFFHAQNLAPTKSQSFFFFLRKKKNRICIYLIFGPFLVRIQGFHCKKRVVKSPLNWKRLYFLFLLITAAISVFGHSLFSFSGMTFRLSAGNLGNSTQRKLWKQKRVRGLSFVT